MLRTPAFALAGALLQLRVVCADADGGSSGSEQLRFTNWHDKLADRRKGLYEGSTQMITLQQSREIALSAIARHMRARVAGAVPATTGTEIYEFGVYTGGGLRSWLRMMRREGLRFDGRVWGFDSFEGMPSEDARFKTRLRQRDKGWLAGGLNAAEQLGVADWETLCRTLVRNIVGGDEALLPSERVHMVRGFYNESLAGGRRFAARWRMKPALLVDLDCDLYTSSAQALRFVLDTGILMPGTYVYLDDIMPWVWAAGKGKPALEQKLAFEELSTEFGLQWEEVPLNATRRDYVYKRPVLMLTGCARCHANREARAKRQQADAGGGAPTMASAPPNCMVPGREHRRLPS